MAKLTMDQVKKFNAKCENGFILDVEKAVIWNDKTCVKDVKIDDESGVVFRFIIEFIEKSERWQKVGVIPVLVVDKLIPTNKDDKDSKYVMYRAIEMKRENLGEMVQRKSVKILQDLTKSFTDEKVSGIIKELLAA